MNTSASDQPSQDAVADTVASVIKARRTTKRLVDPARRHETAASLSEAEGAALQRMLSVAGLAPFHKPAAKKRHPVKRRGLARGHQRYPRSCALLVRQCWLPGYPPRMTLKVPARTPNFRMQTSRTWPPPGPLPKPKAGTATGQAVAHCESQRPLTFLASPE